MLGRRKKVDTHKEYREFVRYSVEDGSFFRDSLDWYIFRYLTPFCDRSWLFFTTISSAVITYALIIMIINAFPIVQKVPVVIYARDTVKYFPTITNLRDSDSLKTIEESIIKYLAIKYVKDREEFDFSKMTTNDLNEKFNIIKNNSTPDEYNRFKSFVSLANKKSPIKDFGRNVSREIQIKSFSFKREVNKDFLSKAKNFVYTDLPSQADVEYKMILTKNGKKFAGNYVARVSFKFLRINNKNLDEDIAFKVSDYKLYNKKNNED